MTTNTPNQTLTFPFGETPEEVIRERLYECGQEAVALKVVKYQGHNELLTVLRALKSRTNELMRGNALAPEQTDEGALRIQILAALGIDEGGE